MKLGFPNTIVNSETIVLFNYCEMDTAVTYTRIYRNSYSDRGGSKGSIARCRNFA